MRVNEHKNYNLKIGITQGDFNGSSYELVLKALRDNAIYEFITPVFFGCPKLVSYFRNYHNLTEFSFTSVKHNTVVHNKPNLYTIHNEEVKVTLGEITDTASELGILSLNKAHTAITNKMVDALVCGPISSIMLKDTSPHYVGSGSFFINKLQSPRNMQILCNDNIKLTAVTRKENNEDIKKTLTVEYLFDKIKTLHKIMYYDFMIMSPKIAILATNSLDDKGKYVGGEIESIIEQANLLALQNKIQSFGPYFPSTFFANDEYKQFDVIMSITYQQSEAVFSLISGTDGVVYTSGLPFVVTEPYHLNEPENGDSQAMRNAIYYASDITKNRRENYRLRKNALGREPYTQEHSSNNQNIDKKNKNNSTNNKSE